MSFHVGKAIQEQIKIQERSVVWFARKICCTRTHAYRIFEKENIDIILLSRICKVLNYDFFKDISENMRDNEKDEHNADIQS